MIKKNFSLKEIMRYGLSNDLNHSAKPVFLDLPQVEKELIDTSSDVRFLNSYMENMADIKGIILPFYHFYKQESFFFKIIENISCPVLIKGLFSEKKEVEWFVRRGADGIYVINPKLDAYQLQYYYEICFEYGSFLFKDVQTIEMIETCILTDIEGYAIRTDSKDKAFSLMDHIPRRIKVLLEGMSEEKCTSSYLSNVGAIVRTK